jgi:hypothetical protein
MPGKRKPEVEIKCGGRARPSPVHAESNIRVRSPQWKR